MSDTPTQGGSGRVSRSGSAVEDSPASGDRQVRFLHPKTKQVVPAGHVEHHNATGDEKKPAEHRVSDAGPAPPAKPSAQLPVSLVSDAMQNERFLKILQRDFCNLTESLLVPGRAFILESRALRTKSFGRKDEYTIHLFSDCMFYSEKTTRGFLLHKVLPLKYCVAVPMPSEHPFAFQVKCRFPKSKEKEVVFTVETMRECLLWMYQLRLFITRAKRNLSGKPGHWHPQVEESRFTNRKTYWLLQRKNRLKEKIITSAFADEQDLEIGHRFNAFVHQEPGQEPKDEKIIKYEDRLRLDAPSDSDLESDTMPESKSGGNPRTPEPLIDEDKPLEKFAEVKPPLRRENSSDDKQEVIGDEESRSRRAMPEIGRKKTSSKSITSQTVAGKVISPVPEFKKELIRTRMKPSKSMDELYRRPANSKFKPNKSREELVVHPETYENIVNSREKHFQNRLHYFDILREGAWLIKHDGRGNELMRWFRVSDDGTELCWGKQEGKTTGSANLADVTRLEFGPFSERFRFYRWEREKPEGGRPWLCFTVYFFERDRTIDIECTTEQELKDWFLGLQYLIPLWSAFWLSRGELLWTMVNMKADQLALEKGYTRAEAYMVLLNTRTKLPQSQDMMMNPATRRKNRSMHSRTDSRNSSFGDAEELVSSPSAATEKTSKKEDPAIVLVPTSPKGKNY